ncbi:MAG: ribonuclease III [Deltaproteobacteria bacterium]|nr:ribonuclease III [Deltaproteobacteria bacterium]
MSEADDRQAARARLEEALGHRFARPELLAVALRHSSSAHELRRAGKAADGSAPLGSNERLEFLGDSVLGFVVAHALYRSQPDWQEGDLSRSLHALVEGRSLERLARSLGVGPCLELGRTERQSGGEDKPSILADAMEALIGAIYLDGGLDAATGFILRVFGEALGADAARVERDPKTELQERLMAAEGEFPIYRLVGDSEVEGDPERFTVEVVLARAGLARGIGRTKRAAERRAAAAALADQRIAEAGVGSSDG